MGLMDKLAALAADQMHRSGAKEEHEKEMQAIQACESRTELEEMLAQARTKVEAADQAIRKTEEKGPLGGSEEISPGDRDSDSRDESPGSGSH